MVGEVLVAEHKGGSSKRSPRQHNAKDDDCVVQRRASGEVANEWSPDGEK